MVKKTLDDLSTFGQGKNAIPPRPGMRPDPTNPHGSPNAELQVDDEERTIKAKDEKPEDTVPVEILQSGTILNGHKLDHGTIVEMTAAEIDVHREHGICLGPVADGDKREVFDHRVPAESFSSE